ncbi:LysR substrate binding domain protein [Mesorhizobium plurifarium]|uniref:LysR substrate binding domain protein n=1 Tax=Mesorhizobium plurifarium TaxID=69974 RepID=A0A090GM00_MESPL|nr:LysR substrate binding domain protein [Mesorhizobium plurifarium]
MMWRRLPPSRMLVMFEAVIQCGGVTRAATTMNVSQPSVTQTIRQLEEHIGVPLFDRTVRPLRLTEAGRLLHEATYSGFNNIISAIDEMSWLKGSSVRPCTVAAPVGFATYWLMPRLAHFSAQYPDYPVNVLTTQEGAPLLSPRVDIAIRFGSGPWTDGQSDNLFDERIRPVCSPALARKSTDNNIPFDNVTLIHVEFNDSRWTSWDEYLQMTQRPKRGIRNSLHFTNYVQAAQAALDGRGLMLGWRSITYDMEREGRLVPMYGDAVAAKDSFVLVRKFDSRNKSVELLAGWLIEKAKCY